MSGLQQSYIQLLEDSATFIIDLLKEFGDQPRTVAIAGITNIQKMKEFNKQVQKKFNQMSKTGKLFRVKLTGQEIWDAYLNSFTKENNPTFRDPESSIKNCNNCKD